MLRIHHQMNLITVKLRFFICCILGALCTTCDRGNLPTSTTTALVRQSIAPHPFIPWVEINSPRMKLSQVNPDADRKHGQISLRDHCITGLKRWSKITDKAIVTTRPGKVETLYPDLMQHKPKQLEIIGGLKTYILPGASPSDKRRYDFTDKTGWKRIVKEAKRIVQITGTNVIVLENETALKPFHQGKFKIDFDRLRHSLAPLKESGIEFWWWWPAVLNNTSDFPDREKQTAQLTSAVADAVPNSIFIGSYHAWQSRQRDPNNLRRRQTMIDILGPARLHEILYVQPDGFVHYSNFKKKQCYRAEEVQPFLDEHPKVKYILYPGVRNWVAIAEKLIP